MTRTAEFKASLSKATTRRTSISYKTVGISAEDPHDFIMQEGQLIFEPGEYQKKIHIRVREDEEGQPAERFLVSLFNSDGLEIVQATARTGDTITVTRGAEGTIARTFIAGDAVELRMTAGVFASKEDVEAVTVSISDGVLG